MNVLNKKRKKYRRKNISEGDKVSIFALDWKMLKKIAKKKKIIDEEEDKKSFLLIPNIWSFDRN